FNLYMTVLFVKPLMKTDVRTNWKESRLHQVAKRTLVASVVSLLVSLANIMALTILNGRERGVLCLTCCTVDVTINVIIIHWVTTAAKLSGAKVSIDISSATTSSPQLSIQQQEDSQKKANKEDDMSRFFSQNNEDDVVPSYYDTIDYVVFDKSLVAEEDLTSVSRRSSIQESQSSRKSLTNR
ncbi:MAG: hypothetical protein EXX96DRAFT_480496, partial [Benjaminiella poitrasii]